jgi:glucoside 3-dehydrogenase (cytochrome c) hitch-hiker subunit
MSNMSDDSKPDSNKEPIDFRQDRRAWLKTSATAIGASFLTLPAATIVGAQEAAVPAAKETKPAAAAAKSGARFFTPAQHKLVDELTETIIPKDSHSGGAKDAKVADFIDQHVGESGDNDQKELWREGLRLIDSMSQHYTGKTFLDGSPEDRVAVLTVLADNEQMTDLVEVRFYKELKQLTVLGYYTSSVGIHDELEYKGNRYNQEFVGCDDPTPK